MGMGLLFMAALGIAAACMLLPISPWIWAVPFFVAYISGFVLIIRHGDRITVADGSHALQRGAQQDGLSQ
jgi:hypothetical protein